MIILSQVPYIAGDVQDANHIRVENHHSVGLTWSTVKIEALDGTLSTRYVRCVSSPDQPRWPRSIVVHLKPLPQVKLPTVHCRDISTIALLKFVNTHTCWPNIDEYNILITRHFMSPIFGKLKEGSRLVVRKQRTLQRKNLIAVQGEHAELTTKGQVLLAGYVNAGF